MTSDLYPVLPGVALVLFAAAVAAPVFLPRMADRPERLWFLPLAAAVMFFLWSLHASPRAGSEAYGPSMSGTPGGTRSGSTS